MKTKFRYGSVAISAFILASLSIWIAKSNSISSPSIDSVQQPIVSSEIRHSVNQDQLIDFQDERRTLVTSSYIGWAEGWDWDKPKLTEKQALGEGTVSKVAHSLHFRKQSAHAETEFRSQENWAEYTYKINFDEDIGSTIGGGIEFKLNLLPTDPNQIVEAPELLPNKKGWIWKLPNSQIVKVESYQTLANVYFERGQKQIIRAMFFADRIVKGSTEITLRYTVSGGDFTFNKDSSEKGLNQAAPDWLPQALKNTDSPVDLSYLNHKPAGKHGFVKARGEQFTYGDGSEARFFGVNIQAGSLFLKDKELIKQHAARLAKLGFNLVRLHHHDSATWVRNSLVADGDNSQELNKEALDIYFWWIKSLKEQGIYVWVDLYTGRPWRKGDLVPGWETDIAHDANKHGAATKGLVYLNPRMQSLIKNFNEQLLTETNPYTGLSLVNEPAIMGYLIANENDLTHHFGNAFLADKKTPFHRPLFKEKVKIFAQKNHLSARQLEKTWEPGVSKLLLNDIEAQFNRIMIDHLRSIGVKAPIATTNFWGNSPLYSLPSLSMGAFVDAHSYAQKRPLYANPLKESNYLQDLVFARLEGKPYTVSEYNSETDYTGFNSHIILPYTSAHAAFQDWDAIMLYGYSQDQFTGRHLSSWSSHNNPSAIGLAPASALMYRNKHVSSGIKRKLISPTADQLFGERIDPGRSISLRTLTEQYKTAITLPSSPHLGWLKTNVAHSPKSDEENRIIDFDKNYLQQNSTIITNETGEISRDWQKGIVVIDSPKSQGIIGEAAGENLELSSTTYRLSTPYATVLFSSLDDRPLINSEKILVTTAARVENQGGKIISELVQGDFSFKSNVDDLVLFPLGPNGSHGGELRLNYSEISKEYSFSLSDEVMTHWFLITNDRGESDRQAH